MIKHKKKGTSLAIVFIISTVIMLMLMTSFLVVGNYNISIISRKKDLVETIQGNELIVEGE